MPQIESTPEIQAEIQATPEIEATSKIQKTNHLAALQVILENIDNRLILIDVGARGGALSAWTDFPTDSAQIICFDADQSECDRLSFSSPTNVKYIAAALGKLEGSTEKLHITEDPACSSFYKPRSDLTQTFPELSVLKVVKEEVLKTRRLDNILADLSVDRFDAIKIDTQGSELDILIGADDTLKSAALIEVEVEFNSIYEGQPLFSDVDRLLRERGFELLRLPTLFHYDSGRDAFSHPPMFAVFSPTKKDVWIHAQSGQLFWADAHYIRSDLTYTKTDCLDKQSGLRAAAILANSGYWRLAIDVIARCDQPLAKIVFETLLPSGTPATTS